MEAQTDIQTYMEQGKQLLAQGQARDAAIAYAHAAQLEPDNPMVRLGLAEANLGLGNYGVVQMACRRVQELQPAGGIESMTAQALLDLLDHRYDRALQQAEAIVAQDPSIAYVHAMRSYLLRVKGQDYDANLARARAARLSYGGHFDDCFPKVEPMEGQYTPSSYTTGYNGYTNTVPADGEVKENTPPQVEREPVPTWSRPNGMQRQVIRTRFVLSQYPNLVTFTLIAINVIVFIISLLVPSLVQFGEQDNQAILHGEYWRLLTAMFLHAGIFHIGFNMLSLYFVGRIIEVLYGKWRYLVIYFLSGLAAGLFFLFTASFTGQQTAVGASGAIFGIFGAFGVFFIVNRRALGVYGRGAIGQWIFWLALNLAFGLTDPNIALSAHIGGLVAGMILAILLAPRLGGRSRRL